MAFPQIKLPPNEFTTLILKARGPRRGALGLGGAVLRPGAQKYMLLLRDFSPKGLTLPRYYVVRQ